VSSKVIIDSYGQEAYTITGDKTVAKNKTIVIITDDTTQLRELAGAIAAIVGENPDCSAVVFRADTFSGSALLPAHAFFMGCAEPNPPSFSYLETFFAHINLAGRPCGIFASNAHSSQYLSALVRNSEPVMGKPFLAKNGAIDTAKLRRWIHGVLKE
jgi:hypothetical protein